MPNLHAASFSVVTNLIPAPGGANPEAGLLETPDGTFYGTTYSGGTSGVGTVFKISYTGVETTLASFNYTNGAYPGASLTLGSDGNLYGTTEGGGSSGVGTAFKITPAGVLTSLASFNFTNGATPVAGMVVGADNNFYGVTSTGTIFKLTPTGTLTSFATFAQSTIQGGLILGSDGNFYGTTYSTTNFTGQVKPGSIFRISPTGTISTVVTFNTTNGANPAANLIVGSDGNFYGTTEAGGTNGVGTIFKLTQAGAFSTVFSFSSTNQAPNGPTTLVQLGGSFYGTTIHGGSATNAGTVYRFVTGGTPTTLTTFSLASRPSPGLIVGLDNNLYGTTYLSSRAFAPYFGSVYRLTTTGPIFTVCTFNGTSGFNPLGRLVQGVDGKLYGTTSYGGTFQSGTIFSVTPSGTYTTVVSLNSSPYAGLTIGVDGNFYGTTRQGGTSGSGTAFQLSQTGSLTTLASFSTATGAFPQTDLILGQDGNFYGTTNAGGTLGMGTAFQLTTTGSLTPFYSFANNNPSSIPSPDLVQGIDTNFYGINFSGGSANQGSAFQLTSTGTYTSIASFTALNGVNAYPSGLIRDANDNFYGTTFYGGGSSNAGSVFQLTSTGTLTTLATFNNTNGAEPQGGLIQAKDSNFYGVTQGGGTSSEGTVFQMTPAGVLTSLVSFNGTNGGGPQASLIQASDGNLYGTTPVGGIDNGGVVFCINPNPTYQVSFATAGDTPIVSDGFTVGSTALNLNLNYAPTTGTVLTVIDNTGFSAISGTFSNLPNGGSITASYAGGTYTFSANYAGDDGNDLTLTLTNIVPPPATADTPVLPPWGLPVMATILLIVGCRRLRSTPI